MIEKALQKILGFGTKEFTKKAIEGKWKYRDEDIKSFSIDNPLNITMRKTTNGKEWKITLIPEEILLDPLAWQAVTKTEFNEKFGKDIILFDPLLTKTKYYIHRFLDTLIELSNPKQP